MFMRMLGVIIQAENHGTRQSWIILDLILESTCSFFISTGQKYSVQEYAPGRLAASIAARRSFPLLIVESA
jgi:hypothetical protein